MSVSVYPNILSPALLEALLALPEVITAKQQIDALDAGSISFSIDRTDELHTVLQQLGVQPQQSVPMRWIKGDTRAHMDTGAQSFDQTHLVYLTSTAGAFVVDGSEYPIVVGTGYVFSEGLPHETTGTGVEPRLLLGPMSETGFPVGGAGLYGLGGTTFYIRQDGSSYEYSSDQTSWNLIPGGFPCYVQNNDTSVGMLTIEFTTNMTLSTVNDYFICGSTHIQFGSRSLRDDGYRPVITIDGVTNYPGLIQNGTSSSDGYSNIHVYNLVVATNNNSTLSDGSGWIGQIYYGRGATANVIANCTSSGPISQSGGGIIGTYAGPTTGQTASIAIRGCSSSGTIGPNAGGIVGRLNAGTGWGDITCESCWSTGLIGVNGGGIMGLGAGARSGTTTTVSNCYSTGLITTNAGGICGVYCGGSISDNGSISITNCYSTGAIQNGGSGGAGGIVGGNCYVTTVITNCYSTGAISDQAGGIVGNTSTILQTNIRHCYTSGIITGSDGRILAASSTIPSTCYGEGTGSWNSTNANTVLQGIPLSTVGATWISRGVNQPYELRAMGYTPYTTLIISPTAELVRTYSQTVQKGQSTVQAVIYDASGNSFTILQGTNDLTMNLQTGVISTGTNMPSGIYTIVLRSVGSYNITEFILTVTDAPSTDVPCCKKANFLRGPIDGNTVTELREGNTLIGYMSSRRGLVPSSALLAIKKAYAFKR